MSAQNNKGIVYILTNSAMPGLVKIGMTTRESIDARMKELYSTGVPVPFDCRYACEVKASDCAKIEKALHKAFEPNRINNNREFFSIKPEQATAILELFDRKDVTNEVTDEIENDLTTDDKVASEKIKSTRRPPLNYKEMGIEMGSKLSFVKDPTTEITISGDKRVTYQGEEMSLTAVTKQLLGITHALQPTAYWTFDGKNLRDIYDETYSLEE
ncbi:GIY-YIG nuclease family protein [Bacteroides ihuae]|uniref:GIY-YIG nuclease family protein n=1 Tax=Bacteroides ihuae TaxID=1852362 RepID=UPI0008DA1B96|nr:GIY-YIG nuclease family protein [Bacteroides ihuae]